MSEDRSGAETARVLDYHKPEPGKLSDLIAALHRAGPWWIVPRWPSLALMLALVVSVVGLLNRPAEWTAVRNYCMGAMHNSIRGWTCGPIPMSKLDAVLCVDAFGDVEIWKPWDDTVVTRLARLYHITALSVSEDESKVMALCPNQLTVWDARNGMVYRELLNPAKPLLPEMKRWVNLQCAALSHSGSFVATLSFSGELAVWDICGSTAHEMSKCTLSPGQFHGDSIEFCPDGRRLLLHDIRGSVSLFDVDTMRSILSRSSSRHVTCWLNGGRRCAVADHDMVYVYDCETGLELHRWQVGDGVDSLTANSDSPWLVVGAGYESAMIDLKSPDNATLCKSRIFHDWNDETSTFFADGVRLLAPRGPGYGPAVVDVSRNAVLAQMNPLDGNNVRFVISKDQQHFAAFLDTGIVQVFDHTGTESAWGVMASPWFAAMVLLEVLLTWRLWRDAAEQVRSPVRPRAAGALVIVSAPAVILLSGWAGLAVNTFPHHGLFIFGWLFALLLPAGLCMTAGSSGWQTLASFILIISIALNLLAIPQSRSLSASPFDMFDRPVECSALTVLVLLVALLFISALLLASLWWGSRDSGLVTNPAAGRVV